MHIIMKPFLLLCACIMATASSGQSISFCDQNMQPANKKDASCLLVQQKEESKYVRVLYNKSGPRISKETFAEKAGKIRDGKCLYYKPSGSLDSSGNYVAGVQDGMWRFYAENGDVIEEKNYSKGILLDDTTFSGGWNEARQELLSGQIETQPRLGEGEKDWTMYLIRNLRYPADAQQLNTTGRIMVRFTVDENGRILEPDISRSAAYSLDEEALRLIRESPRWHPASKDGLAVKAHKFQPITFSVSLK